MEYHKDEASLRELLEEDADSAEEAASLLPIFQALRTQSIPDVDPSKTAALIGRISALIPAERAEIAPAGRVSSGGWRLALLILRVQLRVVQAEIWWASAFVMLVGVVITLVSYSPTMLDAPLTLIAPIVTACGLAFLYGVEAESASEIEQTTPVSPALVISARTALVFGFDLILGIVGSVIISLVMPSLSLWPLIGAWLAPMAFLSALAFLISVVFMQSVVGIMVSLLIWVGLVGVRYLNAYPLFNLTIRVPDLLMPGARPLLFVAALVIFGVGLWWCDRRDFIAKGRG